MHTTLVLNTTYEPLTVVSTRRAIVLVLAEKAEIVESGGELRSARCSVRLPRVVRLTRFVRVPFRGTAPFSRRAVLQRDRHRCAYCGGKATTIDHVLPRSRGGRDTFTNCVAACESCNARKGNRLLKELGWTLPHTPVAPRVTGWLVIGLIAADPTWEPYLAN
ncbi:HNH endonuclease [Fodinicola acaciae]|uniref:HNH endonuclease n=1 Tax=Fodinicola acaciae TaxID=2681555 RepID=UPI001FE72AB0|nr:HNH endonuclease [Fodinicola acaciae]